MYIMSKLLLFFNTFNDFLTNIIIISDFSS